MTFADALVAPPLSRDWFFLTANGERHSQREWAEILGESKQFIQGRLRMGWTMEQIVSHPKGRYLRKPQLSAEQLADARVLRREGLSWDAIAVQLGFTGSALFQAVRRVE
jgi:hypothetical protein